MLGDLDERVIGEDELDRVVAEEALVLTNERVLGFGEDLDKIVVRELVDGRDNGEASEELRALGCVSRPNVSGEADRVLTDATLDDPVESGERATADEEDVGRVDREELLVGMLASALRWYRRDGALEDLQER